MSRDVIDADVMKSRNSGHVSHDVTLTSSMSWIDVSDVMKSRILNDVTQIDADVISRDVIDADVMESRNSIYVT